MFDTYRLMRDPVSYLAGRQVGFNLMGPPNNSHPLVVGGVPVMNAMGQPMGAPYASPVPSRMSSPLYDMFVAGPAAGTYRFPSGVSFTASMTANGHQLDLALAPVGTVTGVRVLPWGPDATTYMQLDNAAELWLTGPLSGCNIYAVGNGRNIWVIHANSNANAANVALNNNVKRTSALNFANTLGGANPLWSHLERGAAGYNGLGFVFGRRKGNVWSNYYDDGQGTVIPLR